MFTEQLNLFVPVSMQSNSITVFSMFPKCISLSTFLIISPLVFKQGFGMFEEFLMNIINLHLLPLKVKSYSAANCSQISIIFFMPDKVGHSKVTSSAKPTAPT